MSKYAKALAAQLNGREYGNELGPLDRANARVAGLVIVFGASDDLVEIEGAISAELEAYEGSTFLIDAKGVLDRGDYDQYDGGDDDENPLADYFDRKKSARSIEAVWGADGYSWTYRTDIPHETFEIVEDGEPYCRGIVFDVAELAARKAAP